MSINNSINNSLLTNNNNNTSISSETKIDMGERIRDITKIKLHGMPMNIELNAGTAYSADRNYIHIQNERLRLELSDKEYLQMAIAVRVAADKVRKYKIFEDEG